MNTKHTGSQEKIEKTDIILINNVQIPDIAFYLPINQVSSCGITLKEYLPLQLWKI